MLFTVDFLVFVNVPLAFAGFLSSLLLVGIGIDSE